MKLDLVDAGLHRTGREQLAQMPDHEVAHADGARLAFLQEPLARAPAVFAKSRVLCGRERDALGRGPAGMNIERGGWLQLTRGLGHESRQTREGCASERAITYQWIK